VRVRGSVTDASGNPVPDARVTLLVANTDLARLYTDNEGRFEHVDSRIQRDQTLVCRVHHELHEPKEVVRYIDHDRDEVALSVVLSGNQPDQPQGIDVWMGLETRRKFFIIGSVALFVVVTAVSLSIIATDNGLDGIVRLLVLFLGMFMFVAPLYMIVSAALVKGYLLPVVNAVVCALWALVVLSNANSLSTAIGPFFLFLLGYLVVGSVTTAIARAVARR
jgi:hypothetical protein